jgi:hypothetical protein
VYPALLPKNLISFDVNRFIYFFLWVQFSLQCKGVGRVMHYTLFIFENFWTKFGLKLLFRIPNISENFARFVE